MTADKAGYVRDLRAQLRDLYDDYFACLEDQELERWPSFFTEDARYQVQSAENFDNHLPIGEIFCVGATMIRDRAKALRETSVFEARRLRHFMGTLRVSDSSPNDTIRVEASYLVVESISGDPLSLYSAGLSHDEIVRTPAGLRFKRRIVVYDHTWIRNTLAFPL